MTFSFEGESGGLGPFFLNFLDPLPVIPLYLLVCVFAIAMVKGR